MDTPFLRARSAEEKGERRAHLLLLHCQEVDVCLEMLRDLVARGRDWRVVQELLRHAQAQVCTRVNRDLI